MNPLDQKIIELKGWKLSPDGMLLEADLLTIGEFTDHLGRIFWSTSDSKALELVDELTHDSPDRLHNFSFSMDVMADGRLSVLFAYIGLRSKIPTAELGKVGEGRRGFGASDENTPEGRRRAICRAYIAAVTWMKEKKG